MPSMKTFYTSIQDMLVHQTNLNLLLAPQPSLTHPEPTKPLYSVEKMLERSLALPLLILHQIHHQMTSESEDLLIRATMIPSIWNPITPRQVLLLPHVLKGLLALSLLAC